MQPLAGVLVVDLTRYLPGAFASRALHQRLGARVVRVEAAGGGIRCATSRRPGRALNAGKESVACDLKRERELAQALLARGRRPGGFRPGVAARLASGRTTRPHRRLLLDHGLRPRGSHVGRAGHDLNYAGWAGMLEDTAPGLPPLQPADLAAGALTAVAQVLAALLERTRTGRGDWPSR